MPKRKHAYILILPSLFTTGNLFFGFYSIVASLNGQFERAAYALFIAGVFDVLDGRIARMTRSTSDFGVEYDSMADLVSFGMAPALMAYTWKLQPLGRLGWAVSFLFVACGALRLARFSAYADTLPKSYFLGLPSPAAALSVSALVISGPDLGIQYPNQFVLICVATLGLLMVSNVRYRSIKDLDIRHRRRFFQLVPLVVGITFIAVRHELAALFLLGAYVLWGPFREGLSLIRHRGAAPEKASSEERS